MSNQNCRSANPLFDYGSNYLSNYSSKILQTCLLTVLAFLLASCGSTPNEKITTGIIGASFFGGRTPSTEIEQIYYLGVFDPEEQVPPSIYRVRVHGQASALNTTKFSSGWVRADLLDSLNTHIGKDPTTGRISVTKSSDAPDTISTGRRLMIFGPEGFREAPRDHRLVIVMGSSPQNFFNAMDSSLGAVNDAILDNQNSKLVAQLFTALTEMQNEQRLLDEISKDIESELEKSKEGI